MIDLPMIALDFKWNILTLFFNYFFEELELIILESVWSKGWKRPLS